MDPMIGKIIDTANFVLNWTIIAVLIYMMLYPIPEETKAMKECNEKLLCKYGDLKGKICDIYNIDINNTLPNISLNVSLKAS